MQRLKSLVIALDVLGFGALFGAGLALVDALGLIVVIPESEALSLFMPAFALSLAAFMLARVVQIGHLMHTRVDPRRVRELRAAQVEALPQPEATPTVSNPFQRAA